MASKIIANIGDRNKARLLFFAYALILFVSEHHFSFMLFNLFLAYASLEISYLLPLFRVRKRSELPASLLVYVLFLLMSPNVFYIVTDLIHLNAFPFRYTEGLRVKEWWHFTILVSGVFIAVFYYATMIKQVLDLLKLSRWSRWSRHILFAFIVLNSVGIYIGRFLRFHSVHLFTEPFKLMQQFIDSITRDALLFIGWITLLQLLVVWMFARAGEGVKT
ncbi:DUF1361 domain-containing protein [Paenibacillus sp. LHD-117]|uniref:DUF1361 domain-containing protein n=1 Tax=Paenibacillus sp. LHD-117 TaxID=3071412 RepID=UPI0027DEE156|nr:DUF1361 domain-containing protein [Paenibacillus sp. LHD-117]MDQ6420379.1 DUF1361 domain-containing protein [Paenibacillus sp. LHD-117]